MGFLANTHNSVQFSVTATSGAGPGTAAFFPEYIVDSLKKHAFNPIHETSDEKSVGWVNLFDPTVFTFDNPGLLHIDHYLAFSLRLDQRKVPGAVLRERFKAAGEKWLADNPGYTKIPKVKNEDLKEAARGALLAQLVPVPTIYDVVWDLRANVITFCNLSQKAIELFQDMFKKSFPAYGLRFITPYERAFAICGKGDMDGVYIRDLVRLNRAVNGTSVLSLIKENEWLGHDFLLWLLYLGNDGGFTRPDITAYIDQKILLAGAGDNGPQKIVFSGDHSKIEAVKAALSGQQQITVARIFIEQEDNGWAFTLRGSNFEMAAYKCPPVRLEKDDTTDPLMERQAVFLERVALADKGRELFETVFRAFLMDRLSVEWTVKQADIAAWLGTDL